MLYTHKERLPLSSLLNNRRFSHTNITHTSLTRLQLNTHDIYISANGHTRHTSVQHLRQVILPTHSPPRRHLHVSDCHTRHTSVQHLTGRHTGKSCYIVPRYLFPVIFFIPSSRYIAVFSFTLLVQRKLHGNSVRGNHAI